MPVAFGVRCVLDLYCSNILQTSGLQLCDHGASSSYGAAQCYWLNGGCQGTNNNNCYPNHMWSGSLFETGYYRAFKLISSNLTTSDVCDGAGKCVAGGGFTVRCVLVLIPTDVCSSASGEQALLTALRSAAVLAAAARALTIPTATRTPFGLIQRQT